MNLHRRKKSIVDRFKLIYLPLSIALISVIAVGGITSYISGFFLLKQMKQDGINLALKNAKQFQLNTEYLYSVDEFIQDKIKVTSDIVLNDKEKINNDLLKKIQLQTGVDEINFYSSDGKILYSTKETNLGLVSSIDNFVNKPIELNKKFMEDVTTNNGQLMKYGYIRDENGNFI